MKMIHIIQIMALIVILACGKKSMVAEPLTVRIINVGTSSELKAALASAKPGDEIIMSDGVYKGKFVVPIGVSGTAAKPITLKGNRGAVLGADNINSGYVLYLQSSYWIIKGFSITNGLKGIMIDGSTNSIIDGVKVYNIGEEAIHLRKNSSHNTIQNCDITETGLKTADYGEGIYIGSAKNNWANYSEGKADLCDSNKILNNKIGPNVKAECIDVKEGTTGNIIRGNTFDAAGITGANSGDSWIDVKGNYTLIEDNIGINPGGSIFKDGYQVHCVVNGWGNYNIFKNNVCTVNAAGFGFNIQLSGSNGTTTGNKVYNNNTVTGAVSGVSNIPLSN